MSSQTSPVVTTEIELLPDAEFNSRLGDPILEPTLEHPIATLYGNEIQFAPKTIQRCVFTYLRIPVKPIFDYDIVNTQVQYLAPGATHTNSSVLPSGTTSTSVELEWPEINHISFVSTLLAYCGINLRENQITQYAEAKKARGI